MIPCRLDRTIRCAQRFHELHIEMGRQVEQGLRIYQDGATVLPTSFNLRGRGGAKRSDGGDAGRGHGGFFEECSSSQGWILPSARDPLQRPILDSASSSKRREMPEARPANSPAREEEFSIVPTPRGGFRKCVRNL